jgi:hypothetical protein
MWLMALLLVGFTAGCGEERGVPTPVLTSISPTGGAQGQTLPVTLTGTSFTTGSTVNVNGALITVTNVNVVSSTQITATFAIAANATLGAANISVTSSGFTTSAVTFTIGPPLAVSSVVPPNGATGVLIDQVLSATFNQSVNCATITSSTFVVKGPTGAVVAGTLACAGAVVTFTPPVADFATNSTFTVTITTAVTNTGGAALASNYVWSFTTGSVASTTPPTVTAVTPLNNATGVGLNTLITAAFDEAMTPGTMTAATFTLTGPGATAVGGAVTFNSTSNIVTLTPASALAPLTLFTATVTTGVKNLAGVAMAANFVWTFTTGAAPDLTPPTVISTNPLNLATGVPLNQLVAATFSKPMNPATISGTTFTLAQGATPISGAVTYAAVGNTATFTPTINLTANTLYTATITTGVTDVAGNHLVANYVWTFTTGTAVNTPPTVLSTNPVSNAVGVCTNGISATFSTAMNPLTINTATFLVTTAGLPVTGTVSLDVTGTIATFTPLANLAASTSYTAEITTGAEDVALTPLAANDIWSFTTGSPLACPHAVALGAAAPFGAFGGGAGITNSGLNTVINGDIGTTAASSTIVGFHDTTVLPYVQFTHGCIYTESTAPAAVGTVNGEIFTAPGTSIPSVALGCTNEGTGPAATAGTTFYVATQAAAGALAAYNTLAGLPPGAACPGAGNGAGLTLAPGTYTCATTFLISGGDLTLDAQGNANAVWVFQIGTALTVGDAAIPRNVLLINGAQPKNVFWQVGAAATINGAGGGTVVGTIIASAGVTFSTAGNAAITVLNGRALALNASVTMVNTVINVPAP